MIWFVVVVSRTGVMHPLHNFSRLPKRRFIVINICSGPIMLPLVSSHPRTNWIIIFVAVIFGMFSLYCRIDDRRMCRQDW